MPKNDSKRKKYKSKNIKANSKKQPSFPRKNKAYSTAIVVLFIIIFILGIHFRVQQYGIEGIHKDSPMLIAGAVLWYHPHDYFPGLFQMYAPLSHRIVGASCMLSGADFSNATKLQPNFLVNIAALVGKGFVDAENYCLLPSYIASILLFIGLIALGLSLLDTKPALYHAAFYAFFPILLWVGRIIYADIYTLLFTVYGILFLWQAYKSEMGTKKEIIYTALAFTFFALSFATKLTAGMYLPIAVFIMTEKYKQSIINKIKICLGVKLKKTDKSEKIKSRINQNLRHFTILLTLSISCFLFFTLLPYELNSKNLIDVYNMHTSWHKDDTTFIPSTQGISVLYDTMYRINTIDLIVFLLSFYVLIKLIRKKNKKANEKYILYLYILGLFVISCSNALSPHLEQRELPYFFGVPLMMSLIFSNENYSIIKYLKTRNIQEKTINIGFIIMITIYILHAYTILQPISPYYRIYSNQVMCAIDNGTHCTHQYIPAWKTTATKLNSILKENETFYDPSDAVGSHMYTRHEDGYIMWYLKYSFKEQTGREMTIKELKHYFNNNGRKLRYLVIDTPFKKRDGEIREIINNNAPTHIVKIKNHPVKHIYDLNKIYPKNT